MTLPASTDGTLTLCPRCGTTLRLDDLSHHWRITCPKLPRAADTEPTPIFDAVLAQHTNLKEHLS